MRGNQGYVMCGGTREPRVCDGQGNQGYVMCGGTRGM